MKKTRPTKMKEITDGEAGYIAGIMDGEGHMYLRREYEGSTHTVVRVRITDEPLVKWLKEATGIGSVNDYIPKQRKLRGGQKRRVYEWCVLNRADVEALVSRIEPYLIVKKRHAHVVREVESLKQQGIFNGAPMQELKEQLSSYSIR